MIKNIFFLSVLLLLFDSYTYAQTNSTTSSNIKLKDVVPPTPNAAALGKFGDVPVGFYTGIPDINISIYDLSIGNFTLPIGISYHAGGIKVEDNASDVGLGWALNAGGTVSVKVNGLSDFLPMNGMLATYGDPYKTLPSAPITSTIAFDKNVNDGGNLYNLAKNIAEGTADGEPDIFYYNFADKSGKFYFDNRGQVHTIPLNNLKIQAVNSWFSITDENGNKFTFGVKSGSLMTNDCYAGDGNESQLLTRIDLADKNFIDFTYTPLSYTYKINRTMARNKLMPGSFGPSILECTNTNPVIQNNEKRLAKITSSKGHVIEFIYAAASRKDLPGTNALEKIIVKYKTDTIAAYTLSSGYFNMTQQVPDLCRLRLDRITDLKGAIHSFEYDTSVLLPSRLSYAQDHWGYYNGKANTTLLPIEMDYDFTTGADRSVDFNYAKLGLLKKINYPTGGSSSFEYEPNDYCFVGNKSIYTSKNEHLYGGAVGTTVTTTFVIPNNPVSSFICYYDAGSGSILDPEPVDPPCNISLSGPGGYSRSFYNQTSAGIGIANLSPGTYTISITINSSYPSAYFSISWLEQSTVPVVENTIAGGARIKQITSTANSYSPPVVKKYVYRLFSDSTRSSGQINFLPKYTYGYEHYTLEQISTEEEIFRLSNRINYYKQTASSLMPLGVGGGSVAYINVTSLEGTSGENGKEEYTYSFAPDAGNNEWHPVTPPSSYEWESGQLLSQKSYKRTTSNSFELLKEVRNFYSIRDDSEYWNYYFTPASYQSNEYLRGWGLKTAVKTPAYKSVNETIPPTYTWNDYHILSKWYRKDSSVTIEYFGGQPLITSTAYAYGNPAHLYPTRTATLNSSNDSLISESHFPQDVVGGLSVIAAQAKDSLIARHIIAPVLESITKKNSIHVRSVRTDFRLWVNSLVLPEYLLDKNGAGAYESRLQYYGYDSTGNLQQQSKVNDIPETYIWGYTNAYPVAKLTGSGFTYAAALSLLNQNILQNPASDQALRDELNKLRTGLPAVMVTTYTYRPLVGVTSITDPAGRTSYYEYNNAGQLKLIKDQNGKILKAFDYQYKQPVTQ